MAATSRYLEVANELGHRIDAGTYQVREALPAERELSGEFGVSRDTMRKAIKLLEVRGYLVSRQGRGTFVTPDALRDMQRYMDGWGNEARRNNRVVGQDILSLGVVAAPLLVARSLEITSGAPVVHIVRVRKLDGLPSGIHDSHISVKNPAALTEDKLRDSGSLYRLLRTEFDVVLSDAAESVSAVAATAEEAKLLEVSLGTPLLRIDRITLSDTLNPVEYCVMKYTQSYSYDNVVRRHGVGI